MNPIVRETSRFSEQIMASKEARKDAQTIKWKQTNPQEIETFLLLILWMGLVRLGSLSDYWVTKDIYRQFTPRATMSLHRYQGLISLLHFNNNETIRSGDSKQISISMVDE